MQQNLVVALAAVLALLVTACSDDPVPAPANGTPTPTPGPSASRDRTRSGDTFDPESVRLDLQRVAGGFEAPLGLVSPRPGDDSVYVVEQGGTVRLMAQGGPAGTLLDISDRVMAGGEQGLLGLAFHPRFEENGRFFVNYTDLEGDTVVAGYAARRGTADPTSERVLLRIEQPFANHNGGQLAFGPDGFLYIATGDGGSAGDPQNSGQRLDTLLGKLLRIDVDTTGAGRPYGIPRSNPFRDEPDARPEIWAYGLRNPWRFSFDLERASLWIADVGQGSAEEIDRAPLDAGGLNYGWRVVEGDDCYEAEDCDRTGYTDPVLTYSHDFGCAVTGGYVYRGGDHPALTGAYVTADFCSGNIWAIPNDVRDLENPEPTLDTDLNISSFGEDGSGELYVTDLAGGSIYKLVARPR